MVIGALVTLAGLAAPGRSGASTPDQTLPPPEPVAWQSAGDSYSSGEGVFGNEGACAQSDRAYGPLTADRLRRDRDWELSSETFTACTGHLVEDYFNEREDSGNMTSLWGWGREQGGPERVDVVTLSFGGNDIGFADLIRDCLDLPGSWYDVVELAPSGCDPAEADIRRRADRLLDPTESCASFRRLDQRWDCDLDIGDRRGSIIDFYYDVVTERLTDRGQLYVVGYPRLFAPVDQWPNWVKTGCQGILRGDSEKLGRLADYLNTKLREAVDRANQALDTERIRFVDRLAHFADGNHELCGTGEDWLNGLSADRGEGLGLRLQTSFHPNAAGHAETADALVDVVDRTFDLLDPANAEYPAATCVSQDDIGWPSTAPISVRSGQGESRNPDGSYGGATILSVNEVTRTDVNGDDVDDIVVAAECSGSEIAMCCAGRNSIAIATVVIDGSTGRGRNLTAVGSSLFGGIDVGPNSVIEIDEVRSVDGTRATVTEYAVYPEGENPFTLGFDPNETATVTYELDLATGEWSTVSVDADTGGIPVGVDDPGDALSRLVAAVAAGDDESAAAVATADAAQAAFGYGEIGSLEALGCGMDDYLEQYSCELRATSADTTYFTIIRAVVSQNAAGDWAVTEVVAAE